MCVLNVARFRCTTSRGADPGFAWRSKATSISSPVITSPDAMAFMAFQDRLFPAAHLPSTTAAIHSHGSEFLLKRHLHGKSWSTCTTSGDSLFTACDRHG